MKLMSESKIHVLLAELVPITGSWPAPPRLLSGSVTGCQLCPFHCSTIAICVAQELSQLVRPPAQALSALEATTVLNPGWLAGLPTTELICQVALDAAAGVKPIAPVS